jgi:amino acid transporter
MRFVVFTISKHLIERLSSSLENFALSFEDLLPKWFPQVEKKKFTSGSVVHV